MELLINPVVLYLACALGAVAVWIAAPRARISPQIIGFGVGALALGIVLAALGITTPSGIPNLYFYVFAIIALGASLRVITHPRPVYAALYFILTILASCGLYLILSATFMAFALVIIYAGAILITYLFVIMLATQAPTEDDVDALSEYDTTAREPAVAAFVGFLLVAVLGAMLFKGTASLQTLPLPTASADAPLAILPGRVADALRDADLIDDDEVVATDEDGSAMVDAELRTAVIETPEGDRRTVAWPEELSATNVEGVALSLLYRHPGTIEIAGVILLMAMLGATVLSRRQVEIDEDQKRQQAAALARGNTPGGGASS